MVSRRLGPPGRHRSDTATAGSRRHRSCPPDLAHVLLERAAAGGKPGGRWLLRAQTAGGGRQDGRVRLQEEEQAQGWHLAGHPRQGGNRQR